MQAQQERWDAQRERQSAELERQAAQAERQRARLEAERSKRDRGRQDYQSVPSLTEPSPFASDEKLEPIKTGNDLYHACTTDAATNAGWKNLRCMIAIGDVSFGGKWVVFKNSSGTSCFPKGVNLEQLKDVVVTYLRGNPGIRHNNWAYLTVAAITEAFPACKAVSAK